MATVISVTAPECCDRCGAQAHWQFENPDSDAHLCLCGHHSRKHMRPLLDAGFTPAVIVVRSKRPIRQ